jgi:hypothetical protein
VNTINLNKYLILFLCTLWAMPLVSAEPFDHAHTQLTQVLKPYVSEGRVDYDSLKTHRAALDEYLITMSKVSPNEFSGWNKDEQLAYLINLYNAKTLQLIIDHYPVKSIKDIGGLLTKPWDLKSVEVFGKKVTLNTIEHEMIRKTFQEPRIHVALVCAAKGCPQLRSSAYTSTKLEAELEEQTQFFLSDMQKNYFDSSSNTLHISPIFKWYKKDFQKNNATVVQFIRDHAGNELSEQLTKSNTRIVYTEYDWSLNDQSKKR